MQAIRRKLVQKRSTLAGRGNPSVESATIRRRRPLLTSTILTRSGATALIALAALSPALSGTAHAQSVSVGAGETRDISGPGNFEQIIVSENGHLDITGSAVIDTDYLYNSGSIINSSQLGIRNFYNYRNFENNNYTTITDYFENYTQGSIINNGTIVIIGVNTTNFGVIQNNINSGVIIYTGFYNYGEITNNSSFQINSYFRNSGNYRNYGTTTINNGAFIGNFANYGQLHINVGDGTTATHAIRLSDAGSLTKHGLGRATLTESGNSTGSTVVNSGELVVAANNALGTGGLGIAGGALVLDGASQTIAALTGSNGTLDLRTPSAALTLEQDSSTNFAGKITGSGIIEKRGTGTLELTGTGNDFTGTYRVGAGTLSGDSRSITGNIHNGATVVFNQTTVGEFAGDIHGLDGQRGTMRKRGLSTLELTGTNTLDWAVEQGTLTISAERFAGNLDISWGTGVAFMETGDHSYANEISGAGTIGKGGAGTLTLTGNSSGFAGTTQVAEGSLVVNNTLGGAVNVMYGARLSGTGAIGGRLYIDETSTLVGIGGQTLNMGNLAVAGTLDVTLGAADAIHAPLFASDTFLTLHNGSTINITDGGNFGAGVYNLIQFQEGVGTDHGVRLGMAPVGVSIDDLRLVWTPNRLNLVNTNGLEVRFWDGGDTSLHNNGLINGGNGVWRSGVDHWADSTGWYNADMAPVPAYAMFMGNGGSVQIDNRDGLAGATGMHFAADGYTVFGDMLTLEGANGRSEIRVGDGTSHSRGWTTNISAEIRGVTDLVKTDFGTLRLTGLNSYLGDTIVEQGTLIGSTDSIKGDLINGADVVFEQTRDAAFNGNISGHENYAGLVTKRGNGALTLRGDNSLDWTIEDGSVLTSAAKFRANANIEGGSLAFNDADDQLFEHTLSGNGTFFKHGAGTLRLTGNSSFGGWAYIEEGTALVDGALGGNIAVRGALGGSGQVGNVFLDNGGTLLGEAGHTLNTGNLSVASDSHIRLRLGQAGGNALFNVKGNLTLGGTLHVDNTAPIDIGVHRLFDYSGSLAFKGLNLGEIPTGMTPDQFGFQLVHGHVNLIATGGADLLFWDGGDNTNLPDGFINGGAGTWRADYSNWTSADGIVNGPMRPMPGFAVFQSQGGLVTLDGSHGDLSVTGMQFTVGGYALDGDKLTLAGNDSRTRIRTGAGSHHDEAIITNIWSELSGESALVKAGAGTLVLRGNNSYTGGTFIEDGTLLATSDNNFGKARTGITLAGGTLAAGWTFSTDRQIELTDHSVIDVAQGAHLTLDGLITGGANELRKHGSGTLEIAGLSELTSLAVVAQGTLIGHSRAFGSGIAVEGKAAIEFNQSWDDRYAGNIGGLNGTRGHATKRGAAVLYLDGSSELDWTINEGRVETSAARYSGSTNIASDAALSLVDEGNFLFSGSFSGDGTVLKSGAGVLTIQSQSSFNGTTDIVQGGLVVHGTLGGTVQVGSGTSLGGAGKLRQVEVANGGELIGRAGSTLSMSNLTLSEDSIVSATLGQAGNNALFYVDEQLVLDGTLNITDASGFGAGVYRLFDYHGGLDDRGLEIGATPEDILRSDLLVQTAIEGQVNLVSSAGAELLFWDGSNPANHNNGVINGGSGSWTAGGSNWTDASGTFNGAMRPRPGFTVFQGQGGDITLDDSQGALAVTGMQFASDGYRLDGDRLELAGPNGQTVIRVGVGSARAAPISATIVSEIAGDSDLVKTDLGTLILAGENSYTGNTIVQQGTLVGHSGAIRGHLANAGTAVFDQSVDGVFEGDITGFEGTDGAMVKRGAGLLTLTGKSTLDWSIEQGELVTKTQFFTGDADIAEDATLTFNQAEDGRYEGALTGSGSVAVDGGAVVELVGNSSGFNGSLTIRNGKLVANNDFGGATRIENGGRLGGTGSVGATIVAGGGIISPGNSIGTLTINGDFTTEADSIYEVEVDAGSTASDLIVVNGRAILNGGTVRHIGFDGNYGQSSTYTILTATDGVDGTFDDVLSDYAFLTPELGYTVNSVTLTLERNDIDFSNVGVTRNQRAAAGAAQALGMGNPIHDAIVALGATEARGAFDSLAGDIYASVNSVLVDNSRIVRTAAMDRMRSAGASVDHERGLSYWMQGLGSWGHLAGDGNARRIKQSSAGVMMGMDAIAGEQVQLGMFGGWQKTDADVRSANAEADINSYHVGVYGGLENGGFSVRTGFAFSWHNADVSRQVAFTGFSDSLKADYRASTAQAFGELAYGLDFGGAKVEPFVGIAHVAVDTESMRERGGAAALRVTHGTMHTNFVNLGARIDQPFDLGSMKANLHTSAAWRRAFGDRTPEALAVLGGTAPFTVAGTPVAKNALSADIGLGVALSESARFDISYSGDVASSTQNHSGRATLSWSF